MKKIFFRKLGLEVTRRCQLKCEHCMRGDAQNLDMSTDIFNSILDQTACISQLNFSGGEPTLAPGFMDYCVEEMKRRAIPLGGVSYITNGVELSDEVKSFLLNAYEYITYCRNEFEILRSESTLPLTPRIQIGLSYDNFHIGYDIEKVKKEYEDLLSLDGCSVDYVNNGEPVSVGRAKNLQYARSNQYYGGLDEYVCSIGMEYDGHHVMCAGAVHPENLLRFCDAFIPCLIYVSAKGKAIPFLTANCEYDTMDDPAYNTIWQYQDGNMPSIFDAVVQWNKEKTMPCYLFDNIPLKVTEKDISVVTNFKKLRAEETLDDNTPTICDPIFSERENAVRKSLIEQQEKYFGLYRSYIRERLSSYSNTCEFYKDFPNANSSFYYEVMKRLKESGKYATAEWICENEDAPWYSAPENLIEYVKHIARKLLLSDFRDDPDRDYLYSQAKENYPELFQ